MSIVFATSQSKGLFVFFWQVYIHYTRQFVVLFFHIIVCVSSTIGQPQLLVLLQP